MHFTNCDSKQSQFSTTSSVDGYQLMTYFIQVWTGNDDCKNETWKECKKVLYEDIFQKDMENCTDSIEIPYFDCNQIEKPIDTTVVKCKPKSTVKCEPHTFEKCTHGEYFLQYILSKVRLF